MRNLTVEAQPVPVCPCMELYQREPELPTGLSGLELQVLMFAAKRKLMDEDFACRAAALASSRKRGGKLLLRLFVMLYQQYPKAEILNAVCSILIKADCRDKNISNGIKRRWRRMSA